MPRATMTLQAGRDKLRTEGIYEFEDVPGERRLKLVVDATPSSARFFASNYGKSISVSLTTPK